MNIVFDVDGTICFNGQYIERNLANEIKRLGESNTIIFASARPIRDLLPIVKELKYDASIGGNGSIVQNKESIEVIKAINEREYAEIKKFSLKYIVDGSFNYASNLTSNNIIYKQLDPDNLAEKLEIHKIEEPIKIILVDIPVSLYEDIKKYISRFQDMLSIINHDDERNIDIPAKGINKHSTLQKIIGDESYIAFGNDVNDYELLKHADKSYYVGNVSVDLPFDVTSFVNKDVESLIEKIRMY
ncbi:hydrolase [Staphylococcus microti]|uniref:Hydrolase n=1 Tax=Staphylococcus microti TaxID=569857 RepID=A0A0D6XT43_9STAP|nr:HAD family hydrolase [Staphylococcus microti]KIX91782.1 hydrolase [Staphylococcus microti]PNZ84452.1 hydrolase [Staphylococcus microti]SUM58348.1 hydrolase [Staphylococcus microti]